MRRLAHLAPALAAIGAALVGVPAGAQTAAHLSTRDISDQDRARDTMTRFAACVVKARPNLTKEALAKTTPGESVAALNDLVKTECLAGGELRMAPDIFRGALYRALYMREFGENAEAPHVVAASEGVATSTPLQAFGDCVLRTAPAATRLFVVADVATPEEKQAFADLTPALGGCVDPREQMRFNRASLEATLAEALYKNSVALSQGAAPGGEAE
jgi:hypothetical protein